MFIAYIFENQIRRSVRYIGLTCVTGERSHFKRWKF